MIPRAADHHQTRGTAARDGDHRPDDAATVARIEKRLGNLEATTAAVERKLDRGLGAA